MTLINLNLGQLFFPLNTSFLGGGLLNYLRAPTFWGLINFDGEHYLSIARDGYLPLTYFYFPLYPLLIKVIAGIIGKSFVSYVFTGKVIANTFVLLSILGIYKLGYLFFSQKAVIYSIILLLLFPTSFFLQSYYTESLFLALVIWSFYFSIKKKWYLAFLLSGLATATRLVGLALAASLVFSYIVESKHSIIKIKTYLYSVLSASGFILYLTYLKIATGDFLAFLHDIEIFGDQRTSKIILLPQVFYRYFFKILPSVNYTYIPQPYVTLLEILSAIVFLLLGYFVFIKLSRSILIYYVLAYLIPTFSGSFSSFPRYSLVLFPAFLVSGYYLSDQESKAFRYFIFSILLLSSFLAQILFVRGYFVS